MSAWVVSFMFSVGASTWLYTKLMRRSGNNTQQSIIVTVVVGIVLLLVTYSILSLFWE